MSAVYDSYDALAAAMTFRNGRTFVDLPKGRLEISADLSDHAIQDFFIIA